MKTAHQDKAESAVNLVKLIDLLQKIDETKPTASMNGSSIDDNNGSRIEF